LVSKKVSGVKEIARATFKRKRRKKIVTNGGQEGRGGKDRGVRLLILSPRGAGSHRRIYAIRIKNKGSCKLGKKKGNLEKGECLSFQLGGGEVSSLEEGLSVLIKSWEDALGHGRLIGLGRT